MDDSRAFTVVDEISWTELEQLPLTDLGVAAETIQTQNTKLSLLILTFHSHIVIVVAVMTCCLLSTPNMHKGNFNHPGLVSE